jgi:eukaryotic-like serine/threonine-protein kinase
MRAAPPARRSDTLAIVNESERPPAAAASPTPETGDVAEPELQAVLKAEEMARARVFFRAFMVLGALTGVFIPLLPGLVAAKIAVLLVLGTGFAICVFALYRLRDEASYTPRLVVGLGVACAFVGVGTVHYIGPFSAGAMALALGIYFFATSGSRAAAIATYVTVVVLHLASCAGTATGVVADIHLFSVAHTDASVRWFQTFMSQIIFGMTFYLARSNRGAMEGAIDRVRRIGMEIRQREAQLAEARRELDKALRPGDGRHSGEVLGAYKLGQLLGRGGMGEVYRAVNTTTGQHAAVKLLHPNLLDNPEHVRRFLREAEVAASVHTDHVVEVLELGRTSDGSPFLAMELLEGHDLGWHLRKVGKLALPSVIELVDELAAALSAMREAGIVHRDLKPGNLFLVDSIPPRWKVLDFGLSKLAGSGNTLTRDQAIGTPSYMAPEQVRGEADHRTDLYAVASIVYRALTGSPPFSGEDAAMILFHVVYSQPPPPAQFIHLPSDVELVLAVGLAKQPADRFACVEDFAIALRRAADGDLDDRTRARGWQILKKTPWGLQRRPKVTTGRESRAA